VDLSEAGNQPMHTDCGNYSIIFNGEIYNHEELRSELSNIRFKGHSDTETILYYLREKGINSVKMFNGIFSLAFLDKKNNQVYLVRDPFGVKPLYYYEKNEIFHSFGSEIRALEQMGAEKVLDYSTLTMFLRLRYYPSPFTMFKNIRKLPPGTIMQIDIGRKKILSTIFFGTVPQTNRKVSVAEALEQYDHLLRKAVKRQLMSDVPLSLLLSGGVDSALLAKLVMEEYSGEIQAYTAGFSGNYKNVNEVEEASFTANYLSLPHKKGVIEDKGFIDALPR
jgi:asparagine synthase (glutamine-hydrolysing)